MLPKLSTGRLTLVPLSDEHIPFEIEMNSNPDVQRYIMGRPATREEILASHRRCIAMNSQQPPRGCWIGFFNGTPIGEWMLLPSTENPGSEAELGYRLMPTYWKQGFASEGASAVLRYAFEVQRLQRMTGLTMRMYAATRATLERVGFVYVGDVPTETPVDHPEYEELDAMYELTAEQWAAHKSQPKPDS
ncbi:hypothetical protein NLG97_g1574 [Lecanicillium saksenae]|uniref:Uncharacterized protein n=1 Tax=Lecanicillium saksenae TaxID=468837 RepID=A0ACC1R587_9HYPO|nr:hypothetical protein NLG97_g1574 [Lecanicillium saksenae]